MTSRREEYNHIGRKLFHWLACVLTVAARDIFDKKLKDLDEHRCGESIGLPIWTIRPCGHSSVAFENDTMHYVKGKGCFRHRVRTFQKKTQSSDPNLSGGY